jgi:uncharacterized membrane protein
MHWNGFKILGGAAIAAGVGFLIFTSTSNCRPVTGREAIDVNVSAMRPGSAQLYCYTDDAGKKLRFVLARGTDGKVRSVFDACRQCFTFHRGYQLMGGEMICKVCGNHYRIDRMADGKASCVPASLPHEDASGTVRIRTADLQAGHAFF